MSRQGWHFEKWSFGLIFRRGEPEEVVYSVEVFPDGRDGDLCPAQNTKEYAQYCEAAGWKLLDSKKKFCIFQREKEGAVPIVEPEERMENVIRAQRGQQRQELIGNVMLALLYWYNFWCYTFDVTFAVPPLLMVIAVMTIIAGVNVSCYIRLEIWVRRSRLEWQQHGKKPAGKGLWYDQYDSRYVWVLEGIWEMEKQRFSGEQLDPAKIPGAQLVLASRDGTKWLVRYPDRIVNLESAQMLEESEQQRVWEAFDSGSEH